MVNTCPSDNAADVDQSSFWSSSGVDWDAHRVGWAISGACTVATVIITFFSVLRHARNYTVPAEQRQIIRILYMPPVYAVVSFLSYRFFRSYTYYEVAEVVYEAITLSAFMLLIIEYVAATSADHTANSALARKEKKKLPIPFCCWRYRPTKAYFLYTIKWTVLQYVIIRPLVSIIAIICQAFNVLCENQGFNFHFANAYLEIVDFFSISIALYGLLMFYGLTKEELVDQRPLAKFLCIKLIVMFTFYQSFVFDWLEGRVIHATQYWTETNIADGLNALTICIEMVFFAAAFMWAYSAKPYRENDLPRLGAGRAIIDSVNFSDFAREIWGSLKFFFDYSKNKPGTHSSHNRKRSGKWIRANEDRRTDFIGTFGVSSDPGLPATSNQTMKGAYPFNNNNNDNNIGGGRSPLGVPQSGYAHDGYGGNGNSDESGRPSVDQYGEDVRLTTFGPRDGADGLPPTGNNRF